MKPRILFALGLTAAIMVVAGFSNNVHADNRAESTRQDTVLLWPNGAPGAVGNEDADQPTLQIFLPPAARANGTAVVICPGGGYIQLDMIHEGREMAEWFNSSVWRRLC